MRIRSIKPEFWRSRDISSLEIEDRLLFVGLWSYVDDNGVGEDRVSTVAADLFADDLERDPSETFARVSRGLQNLSERGRIVRYTVDGRDFLRVVNWKYHQRIDKPNKPRYPFENGLIEREFDENAMPSRDSRETVAPGTEEQGNRGTEEQGNSNPPNPPRGKRGARLDPEWKPLIETAQTISDEYPHLDYEREHKRFVDYWIAQPGQKGVKVDWEATWRNWMRRKGDEQGMKPTPAERAHRTVALATDLLEVEA